MKDYYEDIAKVIYNHVKQNKQLDFWFLDKIVEIIVDAEELNDWVWLSMFESCDKKDEHSIAFYRYDIRQLSVRTPETIQSMIDKYNLCPKFIHSNDKIYFTYLFILQILSHELVHATQYKDFFENKKQGLEKEILGLSLTPATILERQNKTELSKDELSLLYSKHRKHKLLYEKYYDYAPEERQAYILSLIMMNEVAKILKIGSIELYAQENLQEMMLKGYNLICKSPTLYYLKKIGYDIDILEKLVEESIHLDLDERMNLGLIISGSEYETKKLEYDELIQRRQKKLMIV